MKANSADNQPTLPPPFTLLPPSYQTNNKHTFIYGNWNNNWVGNLPPKKIHIKGVAISQFVSKRIYWVTSQFHRYTHTHTHTHTHIQKRSQINCFTGANRQTNEPAWWTMTLMPHHIHSWLRTIIISGHVSFLWVTNHQRWITDTNQLPSPMKWSE